MDGLRSVRTEQILSPDLVQNKVKLDGVAWHSERLKEEPLLERQPELLCRVGRDGELFPFEHGIGNLEGDV